MHDIYNNYGLTIKILTLPFNIVAQHNIGNFSIKNKLNIFGLSYKDNRLAINPILQSILFYAFETVCVHRLTFRLAGVKRFPEQIWTFGH